MARKPQHVDRALQGDPTLNNLGPEIGHAVVRSRALENNVVRKTDSHWTVNWWPSRLLTRDEAISAVVLADAVATRQAWRDEDDPVRDVVERLATSVGLTANDAIDLACTADPLTPGRYEKPDTANLPPATGTR